jgi:hypothetical protein
MRKGNRIILFLIISSLIACKSNDSKSQTDNPPAPCEERASPLDIVGLKDTLKILIEFSDCGEWGGHKELIYLQRNKEQKVFARFIKDTVSCGKIVERNGVGVLDDKNRLILIDTVKVLSIGDEKLISKFLQRLLELYLKNEIYSNAGAMYHVINTDKTLDFQYWNSGDCRDTYYGDIRKQVFGDIMKKK